MNDMYLMVNGRRVEIPNSMVKEINNALEHAEEDEFKRLLESNFKGFKSMNNKTKFNPIVEVIRDNMMIEKRIMYVRLPGANEEWCLAVFKTVEQYCKLHIGCYPDFTEEVARAGFVSIRLV